MNSYWPVRGLVLVLVFGASSLVSAAEPTIPRPMDVELQSVIGANSVTDPLAAAEPMAAEADGILERYSRTNGLPRLAPAGYPDGPPGGIHYGARSLGWIQADYLLWWLQGDQLPDLAVVPVGNVVVGNERLDTDAQSGVRLRGGYFFGCDAECGLMVDFFGFGSGGDRRSITAAEVGTAGLVLPFTDMDLSLSGCGCLDELEGVQSSVPLDALNVTSDTNVFSGGIYGRSRLCSWYSCCQETCCSCSAVPMRHGFRWDAIYGYRYFRLDESLTLAGALSPATGAITATDRYRTKNDFHGFDVGVIYELEHGRWSLEMLGRVGVGVNFQRLSIAGSGNRSGGLFAQYTNIGEYEHDYFTAIPEINLTMGYSITCNLRARFGYSFMILPNVIRPGDQIDTRIDGRFFDETQAIPLDNPLAFFPRPKYETESMWLQGLNFGLEYWF